MVKMTEEWDRWPMSKSGPSIYEIENIMADDFEVLELLSGARLGSLLSSTSLI